MIKSNEQEDGKAQRKKQEEHARAVSAAQKRNREEELRKLHMLATEVGVLMGERRGRRLRAMHGCLSISARITN
jgi:hypothetical protein